MFNLKKLISQNTAKGRHNVVKLYSHSYGQHDPIHTIYMFSVVFNIVAQTNQSADTFSSIIIIIIIIIIIGIKPLGRFGQRPELSQATGIALVCCILGKFLGVVCHCFPPRLDVRLYAS